MFAAILVRLVRVFPVTLSRLKDDIKTFPRTVAVTSSPSISPYHFVNLSIGINNTVLRRRDLGIIYPFSLPELAQLTLDKDRVNHMIHCDIHQGWIEGQLLTGWVSNELPLAPHV